MIPVFMSMVLLHPFHVSIAEAEWNSETKCFELSMRLDPRDLSLALTRRVGKRIDLEKTSTKELQSHILDYVSAKFDVYDSRRRSDSADPDAKPDAKWRVIGIENEPKYVWLYLELRPEASLRHLRLTNRMLFDVAPSQVNTIVLEKAKAKQTLQFSRRSPSQTLTLVDGSWQANVQ